jgi:hypothetical protein
MPPGHEKMSVIYDGSQAGKLKILGDVKALGPHLAMCFPERIECIYVVNNSTASQALWSIVSKTLDPVTASKIVWCGSKTKKLLDQFELDHPYVHYLQARQAAKGKTAKEGVPLPEASPYIPTWERAIVEDTEALEKMKDLPSAVSTVEESSSEKSTDHTLDILDILKRHALPPPPEDAAKIDVVLGPVESVAPTLLDIAIELCAAVEVCDRTYLFRTYSECFLGSEAVSALIALGHADSIEKAETLGNELVAEKLMQHVVGDHGLENGHLFYNFSLGLVNPGDSFDTSSESPTKETAKAGVEGVKKLRTNVSLFDIAKELFAAVELSERTHLLRTYSECFLGSEAVSALISLGHADSVEKAEVLGNALIDKQMIRHVVGDHGLENGHLFYNFSLGLTNPDAVEERLPTEIDCKMVKGLHEFQQ